MGKEAKAKGLRIKAKDFEPGKYTSSVFKMSLKNRIKFLFSKGYLEVKTPAILNVSKYPVLIRTIKAPKAKKESVKHAKQKKTL